MKRIAAAVLIAYSAAAAPLASTAFARPQAAPAMQSAAASAPVADATLAADVTRTMQLFDVPGIAIAVVKDGNVVAAQGFGVRKLGEPARVDGKTLFEVASNSKAFTAAALAMLVDEGKLAWDDPVTKHLPDFQMYDAYVTHEMTVRDLLTHRSGLGLGAGDLLWWPTTNFSTDEIIHKLRFIAPSTSFRSSYAYDNLLYIVAGKIVAAKSGKTWGETIRERILTPVGMATTTTSLAENAGNPDLASPHSKIDGKIAAVKSMPVANAVGAVGINTNAEDIARWMNVLLAGGSLGKNADGKERRLFSDKQARELWTAQTPMRIAEPNPKLAGTRPNFAAYGLGFQLRDWQGKLLALHSGALQGFYSKVVLVPEAKLGIAILTNAESGGSLNALQYQLLDRYLGVTGGPDWIGAVAAVDQENHEKEQARLGKTRSARAARSQPSLARTAYDGDYQDPWYGLATIRHSGGKQLLTFTRTPDLTGELEHFQHDTFIVRWKERNFNADAYVTFSLNPDGSIERMRMQPISTETDFSYDFQDLNFTPVKR
ncbi:serine hydrolase [Massilia forsythiae]|uniref:Serine hydrolase n=1 Tax=Massilia forsythiae TaxID=2728020 RepID=A0A7Z2VUW8_9BURK|nr:serine hydrolase [Massilia forsythiae]QJD99731.1 serine hydrolase [Massilia forsythiae]